MKNTDHTSRVSSSMIEDEAAERLKKRLRDAGLIVNAGAGGTANTPVGSGSGESTGGSKGARSSREAAGRVISRGRVSR